MSIYLKGKVITGVGLGRKLGFPTLNVPYDGDDIGVYAGRVRISDKWYAAAVNLGRRPTVDDARLCEVHVVDWSGEADDIEIELIKKIRDVSKFDTLSALKSQLVKDVEFVKNWYTDS